MNSHVIETFTSIQGEGERNGRISYFIRFKGCNLSCRFCDTKYAQSMEAETIPLEKIKDYLNIFLLNNTDIVITGGEPLLYQKEILHILEGFPNHVTIETNGTLEPIPALAARIKKNGLWSVSPKLEFLDCSEVYKEGILQTFIECPHSQIKIVVSTSNIGYASDLNKIVRLIHRGTLPILDYNSNVLKTIIVQPNNRVSNYLESYLTLVNLILSNYKYTKFVRPLPQLHVLLWGNTKGK